MRGMDWKKWVIVSFFAVMAIPFFMTIYRDLSHRPKRESKYRVKKVFNQVKSFKKQCGVLPEKLADLAVDEYCPDYKSKKLILKDSWGKEIQYEALGENGDFRVYSFGKGGKEGGKGDSADIILSTELTEAQQQTLEKKLELKSAQLEDGFSRIQCQNRPKKGMFGQSDLHVVIHRNEEDGILRASFMKQSWKGTRAYSVELTVNQDSKMEDEESGLTAFAVAGKETSMSFRKITSAANKWRGELNAILQVPSSDKTLELKEILVCRVLEADPI